jgi:hypothetical protein
MPLSAYSAASCASVSFLVRDWRTLLIGYVALNLGPIVIVASTVNYRRQFAGFDAGVQGVSVRQSKHGERLLCR